MKIALLGTRGIPNYYGGFEQFAEYFSVYLAEKGHEVYVYNSHNHKYQESTFHGVHIIHQYDPEYKVGTFGQFIYDFNCILDARKRNFDVILQLGYTSSSIWCFLMPKKSVLITNMDGIEWKRSKYARPVQQFLKFAERLAAISSDHLVSDSLGIQSFLKKRYGKDSTYIAYGAHPFYEPDAQVLVDYQVQPYDYYMIMARFEPENNLDMVLQGIDQDPNNNTPILVVGNHQTKYGAYLKNKYAANPLIRFQGGIYNIVHLNSLRYHAKLYFHGHSVGGTNPSLLEAMASQALIAAHDNDFNRSILQHHAYYFSQANDVTQLIQRLDRSQEADKIAANLKAIEDEFNWERINGAYLQLLESSITLYQK